MARTTRLCAIVASLLIIGTSHGMLVFEGTIVSETLPTPPSTVATALGPVTSPVAFDLVLNIPSSPGPTGPIIGTGSSLTFASGGTFDILGGTISVTDNGVKDVVAFSVDVDNLTGGGGAEDGQLTFFLLGDLVSSTTIDGAMLAGLGGATSWVNYVDFSNSQLSNYSGVVTAASAVPEVNPILGLVVTSIGLVG
ncbi:MAG: hypothetical protein KDB27_34460 [Planctomycetales bacterium]|nr:hypothetical protein [Planctomycetales bacterium]